VALELCEALGSALDIRVVLERAYPLPLQLLGLASPCGQTLAESPNEAVKRELALKKHTQGRYFGLWRGPIDGTLT